MLSCDWFEYQWQTFFLIFEPILFLLPKIHFSKNKTNKEGIPIRLGRLRLMNGHYLSIKIVHQRDCFDSQILCEGNH